MHLNLELFEGPLDVLLYLIKVQEINIFNIPISRICAQFLTFIHQHRPSLNFQQAGEYLVTASELTLIKARMLLPHGEMPEASSLDEVDPNDPRRPLVERLMERDELQRSAQYLEGLPLVGRDFFLPSLGQRNLQESEDALSGPIGGDAYSLCLAFEQVLIRFARELPQITINRQRTTLGEKMVFVEKFVRSRVSCLWDELWKNALELYEIIITFLAILELFRQGKLVIQQEEPFGAITLLSR